MKIIYVWFGSRLPDWASVSFQETKSNTKAHLILLCERTCNASTFVDEVFYIEDFYNQTKQNRNTHQNNFFYYTDRRFHVLYEFAKHRNITRFFHAELDNIIFNLGELSGRLDAFGKGVFVPRDSKARGIGSFIYVNRIESLLEYIEVSNNNNTPPLMNDMDILGLLLNNSNSYYALPTELNVVGANKWQTVEIAKTMGVFDAASIGQYILGIDQNNTRLPVFNGFINENSGIHLKKFKFRYDASLKKLYLSTANSTGIELFNIHVHSKKMYLIRSKFRFFLILMKINVGIKSLISFKFRLN